MPVNPRQPLVRFATSLHEIGLHEGGRLLLAEEQSSTSSLSRDIAFRLPLFFFVSTYRGLGLRQDDAGELCIKVFARVHQGFFNSHIRRNCRRDGRKDEECDERRGMIND